MAQESEKIEAGESAAGTEGPIDNALPASSRDAVAEDGLSVDQDKEQPLKGHDSDSDAENDGSTAPFSILTPMQKKYLMALCASIGMWSPFTMPIYFPIIPVMQEKFGLSQSAANLAVVLYLIFQGLGPTVVGNLADTYGRRPLLLLSLTSFIASNIGLAVSNVYWLILFLRCIQAISIAPVIAISAGIVGDITQRHERGGFMGVVSAIQLVGQGFGALVGAGLTSGFDWRAVFWFLAIAPGVVFIFAIFILPETRRTIVGNLSITPKSPLNRAPILALPYIRKHFLLNQMETLEPTRAGAKFNIIAPFQMVLYPEVFVCLSSTAAIFTTWTMALTSFTSILTDDYGFSTMHVGLAYLPSGMGSLVGAIFSGRLLNIAYRSYKKKYEAKYENIPKDQRPQFDIFDARCHLYHYPVCVYCVLILAFAWTMDKKVSAAAPITLSFFVAFSAMYPMTMAQTVLVDLFPSKSSTSSSVLNLFRCWSGALFVGVLSKMLSSMTVGGCFTFMAALCFLTNFMIYFLIRNGMSWVNKREAREREALEKESPTPTEDV